MTTVEVPYSIAAALPSLSVMDITNDVSREVAAAGVTSGIAYLHTESALSLVRVQERETGFFEDLESLLERVDDRRDVVERERGLRDHRNRLVASQVPRLLRRLDHDGRVGPLAERPDHLDMVRVADERDEMTAVRVAASLGVHLVHERARRIDDPEAARLGALLHRRRDAVR